MKSIKITITIVFLLLTGCAHYMENNSQIVLPTVKDLPALIYPKEAQQNNYSGVTTVEVFISKTGNVRDTRVLRSSGYTILDEAAQEYCEKIIFNPAMTSGSPINSRSVLKIKFDLSDQESFGKSYVSEIKKLYSKVQDAADFEKTTIQREILMKHKEFLGNMQADYNCNNVMMKIISAEVADQWKDYMKYCSLTFLQLLIQLRY